MINCSALLCSDIEESIIPLEFRQHSMLMYQQQIFHYVKWACLLIDDPRLDLPK
jgi:hypothetical protein